MEDSLIRVFFFSLSKRLMVSYRVDELLHQGVYRNATLDCGNGGYKNGIDFGRQPQALDSKESRPHGDCNTLGCGIGSQDMGDWAGCRPQSWHSVY